MTLEKAENTPKGIIYKITVPINPDIWEEKIKQGYSPEALVKELKRSIHVEAGLAQDISDKEFTGFYY